MAKKRLYITLDSLLDTRLGVLNSINPDFAISVTSKPSYYNREIDEFKDKELGELNPVLFKKVLEAKRGLVLKNSFKTKMHLFLNQVCSVYVDKILNTPGNNALELDVNTYPFSLTDEEVAIALEGIVKMIGDKVTINMVNLSHKELTMDYIRDNYNIMIMYNYHEWLNIHTEELKKKTIIHVKLYVPMIFFGSLPTEQQYKELEEINNDPFELSQKMLSPVVSMEYLPISLYCADTPFNKVEYSF